MKPCASGEVGVTNLSKYIAYFDAKSTNRNAKKILLKDIEPEEERRAKREFTNINEAVGTTAKFLEFLTENASIKKEFTEDEHKQVTRILSELLERLNRREWASFQSGKRFAC